MISKQKLTIQQARLSFYAVFIAVLVMTAGLASHVQANSKQQKPAETFPTTANNEILGGDVSQTGRELAPHSEEELRNAVSLDLLEYSEKEIAEMTLDRREPQGMPGATNSALPDEGIDALALELYSKEWKESEALDEEFLSEPQADTRNRNIFTRYLVNGTTDLQTMNPHRAIGKLYFRVPGQSGLSYCTAVVVGENAVLTAGHCLFSPGVGWHTNIAFYPAMRLSNQPYGRFTVAQRWAHGQWITNQDPSNDIGVLRMNPKNGKTIRQFTGKLGVAWNRPTVRHYHVLGYPANLWNGNYLVAGVDQSWNQGGHIIGIGTDMQGGSSGGPWVSQYQSFYGWSNRNIVESVSSFRQIGLNGLFGPYFDGNIVQLCGLAGGCQ